MSSQDRRYSEATRFIAAAFRNREYQLATVGIIVGSTRPGRVGSRVAGWIAERTRSLPDVEIDLIELADVALPLLDEPEHPSKQRYTKQHTREWSARIAALDAFILVTPEYNYSYPAPLKNALDYLSAEWKNKPVALIGYGGTSSGTRAVQALLPVILSLGMICAGAMYVPLRQRLNKVDGTLEMTEQDERAAADLIEKLDWLARSLSPAVVA